MKRAIMSVVLLVTLAACGGDDGAKIGACDVVYAEGIPTPTDVAPCIPMPGQVQSLPLIGSYNCTDGRVLSYNDYGWGYRGETWHSHRRPDGQLVPPEAEMTSCLA